MGGSCCRGTSDSGAKSATGRPQKNDTVSARKISYAKEKGKKMTAGQICNKNKSISRGSRDNSTEDHSSTDDPSTEHSTSSFKRQNCGSAFRLRLAKTKEQKDFYMSNDDIFGNDFSNTLGETLSSSTDRACKLPTGGEEWDQDNQQHGLISDVIRFVCGMREPPAGTAKYMTDYMEEGLAGRMGEFQAQMSEEIRTCGFQTDYEMQSPTTVTFWEMNCMYPSAEDNTLRVFDIIALVTDAMGGKTSCLADLNVYIAGSFVSGFTLNSVEVISNKSVADCSAEVGAKLKSAQTGESNQSNTDVDPVSPAGQFVESSTESKEVEAVDFLALAYGMSDQEIAELRKSGLDPEELRKTGVMPEFIASRNLNPDSV